MHLVVFGASGRLGRQVAAIARQRGDTVAAASRKPPYALAGADAVILTIGPRTPDQTPECGQVTEAVIEAMRFQGVGRILCVTGALVGNYRENRTFLFEALSGLVKRMARRQMEDRLRQEEAVRNSGLRWTVFKPPRLSMGAPHRSISAGPHVRVGLLSRVARADLARLLVEEAAHDHYQGRCVFVRTGIL